MLAWCAHVLVSTGDRGKVRGVKSLIFSLFLLKKRMSQPFSCLKRQTCVEVQPGPVNLTSKPAKSKSKYMVRMFSIVCVCVSVCMCVCVCVCVCVNEKKEGGGGKVSAGFKIFEEIY